MTRGAGVGGASSHVLLFDPCYLIATKVDFHNLRTRTKSLSIYVIFRECSTS
jgi:hypothetical protein